MKDADKPNNLGIWATIQPGVVVDIDGEQWQALTRLSFSSEMMNVCDGRVRVWQQEELEKQGAYVVEGAATLHDRLSQYDAVVRAQELMNAADVRRDTLITQIEKLIDERDEWEDLVMQVREALGFPRTGYCYVVGEVRKLKEAQSDQVIKLQEYIKTHDEHWNKICEAVGLPGQGRTDEEKVTEEIEAMVKALGHHAGYCDVFSEDIKRLAEIADAVEDLCPEDTEPEDFADQWRWTEELVGILRNALGRHRDVMRQVAHIAGIRRVTYGSTDSEYEVCDYDDMLQLLRKLKEAAEEDGQAELTICLERHRRQVLEVLEATYTYPRMTGSTRTVFNACDDEVWTKTIQQIKDSDPKRIEEMDEALEQSLMEIAQQAGVIAELRDELKRAQNSIDDLMYDAANLNGQKEAYERALQIVGGAR